MFRLLERFDGQKPRIDIERALYFTESMRQTEGEHLTLRWAKALMHIAKNISVCVQEDQLLLGRAGCDGRYGILYPELDGDFRRTRSAHPPAIPGVHHGRRRQARGGGNRPLLERQDIP